MGPLLALLLLSQALAAPVSASVRATPTVDPVRPGEQAVDPYVHADANAGAKPISNPAIFRAFHGDPGVKRIAADFIDRSHADPRIKDIFATADDVRLKRLLAEQFCYLLGGGCTYTGRDMASAHRGMGLQNADFNALVENLQHAMDDEGVPFRDQNVLLAKLAPMQRVTVERRSPALLKEVSRRIAGMGR